MMRMTVLVMGAPLMVPRTAIPPEMVKSDHSRMMNGM